MVFSQSVIEQLKSYVYILKDSRNGEVFYVGKGVGNRVFQHLNCALESPESSDKLDRIREIQGAGHDVVHVVLRHGLTEESAFEVEAAAIDLLGLDKLTNVQGGHHSGNYGIQSVDEICAMYDAKPIDVGDFPIILFNLNRLYDRTMSAEDLYQATRKSWVLGDRRKLAKYAVATFRGLTREVYQIDHWVPMEVDGKTRWAFEGIVAAENVRSRLIYRTIDGMFSKGAANPVKYLGC